jgi:hypothetical protein
MVFLHSLGGKIEQRAVLEKLPLSFRDGPNGSARSVAR